MTVTVCIPAYRSGQAIADTVRSSLNQTHDDVRVVVAIDPAEDGSPDVTAAALEPLRDDPRLDVRTNPRRLGWAENVRSLVQSVTTPLFSILPHDDLWHPRYVETLVAAISDHPDAIVAYGDMMRFGATPPVRKSVTIPPSADRITALLHFLIHGTEAMVWRGVTRTSATQRIGGFPTDRHLGFVVECEYALALHGAGVVVHVPRTLYFKRVYDSTVMSASRARMLLPYAELCAGWEEHDRRMAHLLADALAEMQADKAIRPLAHAAKEAALIGRYQQFVGPRLGAAHISRVDASLALCTDCGDPLADQVAANLHMVMRRHWLAAGKVPDADAALQRAADAADTADVATAEAQLMLSRGNLLEAVERATSALRLGHLNDTRTAQALLDAAYAGLGWTQPG